ncbi:MAG: hypothetical protein ACAI35_00875 [Candidatus Methylacidiphilales bacterium]
MYQTPLTDSFPSCFRLSVLGSIRHWLVAGPKESAYAGKPGPEHVLRKEALDYATPLPPASAALGASAPHGLSWHLHDPARNEFVEFSTFYQDPTVVEYYAFTEIEVPERSEWKARFWVAGAADLWVNGKHVARLNVTRYRNPDFQYVEMPFQKGLNRLCVRLQCLGLRDTRILFGIFLDRPDGVSVSIPGKERVVEASEWIDTVHANGHAGLESATAAPFEAQVISEVETLSWTTGAKSVAFSGRRPVSAEIEVCVDGVVLKRSLEIPGNRPPALLLQGGCRNAILDSVAQAGIGKASLPAWNAAILPVLARRLLGRNADEADAAAFSRAIALVDKRSDCADFALAGLLRMEMLGLGKPEESAEIRRAALAFRYWEDEPGNDAMCFWSENHSLLFHGCQLIAGRLYPREVFSNSGRTGGEQGALALPRIRKWLDHIEARGFEEFNSSTYMPITIAAMLNVVDFSGDDDLSARMRAQIDRIFRDLALHAFGGGIITPQGRVYRDVLFPEEAGTQTLLAFATDATEIDLPSPGRKREGSGDWVVFLASSSQYRPPQDLAAKVREPVSLINRHADFQIVLEKTPAWILTSLAVPAEPREGEHPSVDLRPGGAGYQQHIWQATLGRDCHVFVNHPGCFMDGVKTSRPGYWYGNGCLPRLRQTGNWLQAIYVIADGTKTKPEITPETWQWPATSSARPFDLHPIPFTHAHWPADSFDREESRGNWVFGQKGAGFIGMWCSEALVTHNDVLTGRELRANSYASAWLVICGDLEGDGSLEKFLAACREREPFFDRAALTLSIKGEEPMRWWERSEPMPM